MGNESVSEMSSEEYIELSQLFPTIDRNKKRAETRIMSITTPLLRSTNNTLVTDYKP
ncbi:MAG: hypothetical protein BAJATHORv1_50080 [Candidatus Thorarchaeota archaeon]|nr:MAG: hypothetical protein BAJATHORv1_50080 [Candidatus Thorarchaeota archaeon]